MIFRAWGWDPCSSVSFREYISAYQEWEEYYTYGGLPLILTCKDDEEKSEYLISIFQKVYLSDIMERRRIANMEKL